MKIEIRNGKYFNYGNRYFIKFKYENAEEQDKMFELFHESLIPSYGSNSSRSQQGKDYIMPYLVDEKGMVTLKNTGIIGGTSIPEDLLPKFIRRFVELDKAIVKVGDEVIKGKFDYDEFDRMKSKLELQITLRKLQYFNYKNRYFIAFEYANKEQQDMIFELFKESLIPSYGSDSSRRKQGRDYIMPYFVDEKGTITPKETGIVLGTSIPEDLLPEFIRRFVEVDGAIVKVGNEVIKGQFDYDRFNEIIANTFDHKSDGTYKTFYKQYK